MTILQFKKKDEDEYKNNVWYRYGSEKAVVKNLPKKDELIQNLKGIKRK